MPALKNACDPDALSFTDAVRIVRRKITAAHFHPPAILTCAPTIFIKSLRHLSELLFCNVLSGKLSKFFTRHIMAARTPGRSPASG